MADATILPYFFGEKGGACQPNHKPSLSGTETTTCEINDDTLRRLKYIDEDEDNDNDVHVYENPMITTRGNENKTVQATHAHPSTPAPQPKHEDLHVMFRAIADEDIKSKHVQLDRPARELMMWSLLVGKLQMSELFWSMEKESVAGALLASTVLNAMASRTDDFTDKEDFKIYARHFEEQAEGVLNECYREDEQRAQHLINRKLYYYGLSSSIILAAEGESIKFMAHPCCQDFLTSTWYGKLSHKNSFGRFGFGILCGLTCPFLLSKVMLYKPTEPPIHVKSKTDGAKIMPSYKSSTRGHRRTSSGSVAVDIDRGSVMETSGALDSHLHQSAKLQLQEIFQRMRDFYMAPVVRFVYHTIAYLMFIALFSYLLLFKFIHEITVAETIIMVWLLTLFMEEIKQISTATLSGISFSTYISDGWNKLDCTAIGLYIVGFLCRIMSLLRTKDHPPHNQYTVILTDDLFIAARICMAFSLFAFYVRIMYIFSFHIALGPKLIMIGKMVVNDLVPFMVILIVFVFGYGVTASSIAYPIGYFTPREGNFSGKPHQMSQSRLFVHFLTSSYYQMFGELGLDVIQGDSKACMEKQECPHWTAKWLIPAMLGIYILLTNILMFNLLIAMFSKTYEQIESSSTYYWNYQRYMMISEYVERSPLAPPLIFFWHVYELFRYFKRRCDGMKIEELENPFKVSYKDNKQKERELVKWEHMKAMDFLRSQSEPHSRAKKASGHSDNRAIVFRAGPMMPQPTLGTGVSDLKSEMSNVTGTIGLEMEKRFKDIDAHFQHFNDVDVRMDALDQALAAISKNIDTVFTNQAQIMESLTDRPLCKCSEPPPEPVEEAGPTVADQVSPLVDQLMRTLTQNAPAWFAAACEQATGNVLLRTPVSVRDLQSPVMEKLKASTPVVLSAPTYRGGPTTQDVLQKSMAETFEGIAMDPLEQANEEAMSIATFTDTSRDENFEQSTHEAQHTEDEADDDAPFDVVIPVNLKDDNCIHPSVSDNSVGRVIQREVNKHKLWRIAPFNFEKIADLRTEVPVDRVPWQTEYKEYCAHDASADSLIFPTERSYDRADIDPRNLRYNLFDTDYDIRRQSLLGRYRLDPSSGVPLNPRGRTGLKGKGLLPHWGPNHAMVFIITRWSTSAGGSVEHRDGKPVLQCVALYRNKDFCLPWYITDHNNRCDFEVCIRETMQMLGAIRLTATQESLQASNQAYAALDRSQVIQVFKGYLDDQLNADNAWLESVVLNFHENDNTRYPDTITQMFLEDQLDESVRWVDVASSTSMRPSHCELLKNIAHLQTSYF